MAKPLFFSVRNDGCGMGECGKGGKEVGGSGQELNEVGELNEGVWGGGEEVGDDGNEWYFCLSVRKNGKGERVGGCENE